MKFSHLLSVLLLCFSFSAAALDLGAAKDQGWVAERANGQLAVVKAESGVQDLVNEINKKRLAQYSKIAKENGLSLEQVGVLAGKKAIERSESGHLIEGANGTWVKKP